MNCDIQQVNDERIGNELPSKYNFLLSFIEFGPDEIRTIHEISPKLVSLLPEIVDEIYEKMLEFNVIRKHFVVRHYGFKGEVPTNIADVTPTQEQVEFRKQRLINYFTELFLGEFDATTADYMNAVGKMHTTKTGSISIHVPLVEMNIMLGFMSGLFLKKICEIDIEPDLQAKASRALNKLMWIQQSLISEHY